VVNLVIVAAVFVALALGADAVDRWLTRRSRSTPA
jgi:hypothetical protein